ncbi:MAG: hypothetical protein RLZ98_1553 [Pseudomonadota bacterium]|jgi:uncharacterized membrane protein YhaH (DUF805 family)
MIRQMFSFSGELGRGAYLARLLATGAGYWAVQNSILLLLPALAILLAPHGVNAGLVLNGIWGFVALIAGWIILAATARRLRDRGRSPWLALAIIPALASAALWLVPLIGPEAARRIHQVLAVGSPTQQWLGNIAMGLLFLGALAILADSTLFSGKHRQPVQTNRRSRQGP